MEERLNEGFWLECNTACGKILRRERKKKQISREVLAQGLISKTALGDIEEGRTGWTKVLGDTLMNRMGISTDYFEVVASSEELDRWRQREDICMLMPLGREEAAEKLEMYRNLYKKRDALEEQFLLKMDALLMLLDLECTKQGKNPMEEEDGSREQVLEMTEKAVACTVQGDWNQALDDLWLAPAELEAILLHAAGLKANGRIEEAWELQQAVWKYPKEHQWEERMKMLILPQAALLGMKLAMQNGDEQTAFDFGREALELLRHNYSHCYVLPLLDVLSTISVWRQEERKYKEQASRFRDTFQKVYGQFQYPGYRLWQTISVENTRDAGTVLKMLRMYAGKPRAKAVHDEKELVVTERQLEKIEKGMHKPSYENYVRLLKQYGKYEGWKTPILETDSVEVLELRQRISTLLGFREWEKAERALVKLKKKVNVDYPKTRQELLRMEALLKWKKGENTMEESLDMMLEALRCTIPDIESQNLKWWVFQKEEILIVANIATFYRKLGQMDKAEKWIEAVRFSLEEQQRRTRIYHQGYEVLMESCDSLLGEMKLYGEAESASEKAAYGYIHWKKIYCIAAVFYRIAWDVYERGSSDTEKAPALHEKWRAGFEISQSLAEYMYDSEFINFLQPREKKYLG